jgi:hypothetical protein
MLISIPLSSSLRILNYCSVIGSFLTKDKTPLGLSLALEPFEV